MIGEWNDNITTEIGEVTIGPFRIDVLSPTKGLRDELLQRYVKFIEDKLYLNLGDKYGDISQFVMLKNNEETIEKEVVA